ncbi:MAG: LemA family protein [Candidatus Gracilibacteria bacterium]
MYVILAIILVVVVFVVYLYNNLVTLRNKVKEAWADIETQLKRRYDLIPNIVETVKGYAKHEAGTLTKVTDLRAKAMGAQSLQEKAETENMLSETLKSLFAVAENYPDLKANQNFLDLQNTLKEIEEHLQLSRRYYNGTVRDYNTKLEVVPNKFIAGPMGFTPSEFFETKDEIEKENVKVSFAAAPEAPTPTEAAPAATPSAAAEPEAAPAAEAPAEPEAAAEPEAPAEQPPQAPEAPAEPPAAEPPAPAEPEAPAEPPKQ